jgi:ABC-type uncharacterized transport system permease subunit
MSEFVWSLFTLGFLAQAVRVAVPYVLAALGGAVTERSGVIDLALEAKLLMGAFTAAVVTHETGQPAVGLAAAAASGVAVAAIQAVWSLHLKADQVVTGVALNLGALGLTRFLLSVLYDQSANSPQIAGLGNDVATNPITYLTALAVAAIALGLPHTRLGLRIGAAGERPDAVAAAGVSVVRVRWVAMILGGAVVGLGGAQLSLTVTGFVAEMSSGRGYFALAAVIMSGWRPGRAVAICLAFGVADALQFRLQSRSLGLPPELVRLLPYLLALGLLAAWPRRKAGGPTALGRPLE